MKKKQCCECHIFIANRATRCKSCAQFKRWENSDDPRRVKLANRNRCRRNGNYLYENKEWLRVRYEDRIMSLRQIAREAQCSLRTIARWIASHGIVLRTIAAAVALQDRSGPKNGRWQGGVNLVCAICGQPKSFGAKNCCRTCHINRSRGRGNPNWKGYADVSTLIREWVANYWRVKVLARDCYQCQSCGDKTGGNLNAHHIRPLAKIISEKAAHLNLESESSRLAFVEQLLVDPDVTDISNGVTLCEPCHGQLHGRHLTIKDAREIRRLKLETSPTPTNASLGVLFAVSGALIGMILRNKIWKDNINE